MFGLKNKERDDDKWNPKNIGKAITKIYQRLAYIEKYQVDTSDFKDVLDCFFPRCDICGVRRRIEDVKFRLAETGMTWRPSNTLVSASNVKPEGVICSECEKNMVDISEWRGTKKQSRKGARK